MILIERGTEPDKLKTRRSAELAKLMALGRTPTKDDIEGYAIVGEELWRAQHRKCCYCEMIIKKKFHDVEHYRPKASANCAPGCTRAYGYWWLAWTWENLLFACPCCNRSEKNDLFPLEAGSIPLNDHQAPPGQEKPLLLNPADSINPVEHIEFVYCAESKGQPKHWRATARNGSQLGHFSQTTFGLNTDELLELRDDYFDKTIKHRIDELQKALENKKKNAIKQQFAEALRLLDAAQPFVALSYDAMRQAIPDSALKNTIGKGWPQPVDVPLRTS